MTALDTARIERIVREVLAEMGLAPADANGSTASAPAATTRLRIADRVVAAAELAGRIEGVREIVVARRAVLTPAAIDLLKSRNIAVIREDAPMGRVKSATATPATSTPATATSSGPAVLAQSAVAGDRWAVCLVSATRSFRPEPLAKDLESDGFAVCFEQRDCLIASTDELAQEVSDGRTVGVLVTRKSAAALCLANRKPGVRAILGVQGDALQRDAEQVGANVLIVDPRGQGLFAIRRMVRRFASVEARNCPEVFRKQLG
jgi:hypothetical protein